MDASQAQQGQHPTPSSPNSPNNPQSASQDPQANKRKRKALSCYDCRRRKLKCDRVFPACGRCVKGGIADTCTYDLQGHEDEHDEGQDDRLDGIRDHDDHSTLAKTASSTKLLPARHPDRTMSDQARRIQYLEQKLARMEYQLDAMGMPQLASTPDVAARPNLVFQARGQGFMWSGQPKDESMFVRGRGFKTQYFGSTKAAVVISQLPELQNLMHSAFSHLPAVANVRKDFKSLKVKAKEERARRPVDPNVKLAEFLPDRNTIEQHVAVYFKTFDPLYRIVHRPIFDKEYATFWENPAAAADGFVATILLMIAIVRADCVKPGHFTCDSSTAREMSKSFIDICDTWVQKQSHKHMSLIVFQVNYLLLLAKLVNSVKEKRDWMATGAVVRLGMTAGLHREPSKLAPKRYPVKPFSGEGGHPKHRVVMSVYEEELRRRLWATIAELELHSSIERGMPAMMAGFPFDTEAPANIADEDLDEATPTMPPPKPDDVYTTNFYAHHSHRSLKFRIALNSALNDPDGQLSSEDVLKYETKIHMELDAIPSPRLPDVVIDDDGSVFDPNAFDKKTLPARALLDIQLRQFLVILHAPFVEKSQYSAVASINAAARILDLHSQLYSAGIHTISTTRNDIFRSALALSHSILTSNALRNEFLLSSLAGPASERVALALSLMDERTMRFGTGIREYWVVAAANALVQCKAHPEKLERSIQLAVESVSAVLGRIVMAQELSYATPYSSGAPEGVASSTQGPQATLSANAFDMAYPGSDMQISPFDPTSFTDWNLEDFWQNAPLW